ncbi:sugar ABC transporter substrate-binding protein [Nocardiopsis ansamitocini]|uniref:LacI family transcriptional regulator n=1 Tax=Nocardiopsis ansamitocini TaxID=1670832 RepID=A0A9W6PB66_9ACTN|nr:sugar ABC transporter substrate-binding protein [Nocardiopsis ansamitocini]GLU50338.1 LacI family transcriptional regulator [Nocardiopsis ansamitocini]
MTMKKSSATSRSLWAAPLALTALLGGTACGGIQEAGGSGGDCERSAEKVIGFDYPLTSLSVYGDLQRFAQERGEERGYEIRFTADDENLEKQTQNVQTWVTQQIPAIVSYPLEPASMEPLAKEAMGNCTVFVSYASPLENQDASVLFSGLESGQELGKAAAAWAAEQEDTVKVLILNNRDLAVGAERDDGLNEVFPGDADNIEVVSTQKAGTRTDGEKITSTVLQANPDLDMVLAYNDDVGLGARQAFLNAGRDADDPSVFIGGQDGSAEGLQAVSDGGIYRVSVAVRIRDIGYAVTDVPADILEGKETDGVNVPPVAIDSDHPELQDYLGDYSS